ncbi:MAG: quinone oxidoreductase [Microbacteriaceae bacterium]|nr:quinone oxidoreductase [Microbacteriaceae bacterium]
MTHAIVMDAPGGPEVLSFREIDTPVLRPGHVLVRPHAIGVNFIDIYRRQGIYPVDLPHIPGFEGAGEIVALGDGVTSVSIGDRVAFCEAADAYSSDVAVNATVVLPIPEAMDIDIAAALPLQGITAHYLVNSTFPLEPGHTALIHAGAGGVGLLLIQLAKLRGARVITTVSTPEKEGLARAAGADVVIGYDNFDVVARDVTDGLGVDVVFDGISKTTFDRSLASLRPRGMLVLFGAASGPVDPFDLQRLNSGGSLYVTRPSIGHYLLTPEERAWRWNELVDAVQSGRLDVRIGNRYPLAEAARAHEDLAARATTGKLLLTP